MTGQSLSCIKKTWGLLGSRLGTYYQLLFIKPMVLSDVQIAVFITYRTHILCGNATIALTLLLCSQISILEAAWVKIGAILGHAGAILKLSWEGFVATWVHLAA